MSKTKDEIFVELYNEQEVRMVLDHLREKTRRVADRERKAEDNREHLRKIGKAVA